MVDPVLRTNTKQKFLDGEGDLKNSIEGQPNCGTRGTKWISYLLAASLVSVFES